MWLPIFVIASSHVVTGVVTRQNFSSSDESSGRHTYNTASYYKDYYESQNSAQDTSSSYYTPVVNHYPNTVYTPVDHYHQYEGQKYQQTQNGELCTWGNNFMEHILQLGTAKLGLLGLLKAVITAVGAGFITKLPLILFKLVALPVGLLILGLPLLLPFLLPFLAMFIPVPIVSHNGGHGSDECHDDSDCDDSSRHRNSSRRFEERVSRAMKVFMTSEACVGRLACELGTLNSKSEYKKPISWLLGYMQHSAPESEQAMLAVYRAAYLRGNEGSVCSDGLYRCDMAQVASAMYRDTET